MSGHSKLNVVFTRAETCALSRYGVGIYTWSPNTKTCSLQQPYSRLIASWQALCDPHPTPDSTASHNVLRLDTKTTTATMREMGLRIVNPSTKDEDRLSTGFKAPATWNGKRARAGLAWLMHAGVARAMRNEDARKTSEVCDQDYR